MEIYEPYGFIYITTNMINGIKYIGQRKFSNGWIKYKGSGTSISLAIKKHGKENFIREIVSVAYSLEELNQLEQEWIKNHRASSSRDYYNIALGGDGSRGFKHTDEARKKIASKNAGQKRTDEQREKMRESQKGIKRSAEARKNISIAHMGIKQSKETIEKRRQVVIGRKYGDMRSLEGKRRHDELVKKKVICLTTDMMFDSQKEACEYYGQKLHVSKCCKGERKTAGKHPSTGERLQWMHYEEYIKMKESV